MIKILHEVSDADIRHNEPVRFVDEASLLRRLVERVPKQPSEPTLLRPWAMMLAALLSSILAVNLERLCLRANFLDFAVLAGHGHRTNESLRWRGRQIEEMLRIAKVLYGTTFEHAIYLDQHLIAISTLGMSFGLSGCGKKTCPKIGYRDAG